MGDLEPAAIPRRGIYYAHPDIPKTAEHLADAAAACWGNVPR